MVGFYLHLFIISGGASSSERLIVDDDLIVKVDGHVVLADKDGWAQYNGLTFGHEIGKRDEEPLSSLQRASL